MDLAENYGIEPCSLGQINVWREQGQRMVLAYLDQNSKVVLKLPLFQENEEEILGIFCRCGIQMFNPFNQNPDWLYEKPFVGKDPARNLGSSDLPASELEEIAEEIKSRIHRLSSP